MKFLLALLAFIAIVSSEDTTTGCTICQQGVKYLREQAPPIINELKPKLTKICDEQLSDKPDTLKKCKDAIEKYVNVDFLHNDETPLQLCEGLKVCVSVPPQAENLCKSLQNAYNNVGDRVDKLKERCDDLNITDVVAECKKVVDENRAKIINVIQDLVKRIAKILPFIGQKYCKIPGKLAMVLAMEGTDVISANQLAKGKDANPLLCTFCTQILGYMRDSFLSDAFMVELIGELNKLCKKLPTEEGQAQCSAVVDSFVRAILESVRKLLEPKNVCVALQMCGA